MRILNLTQHDATAEQIAAGVYEPEEKDVVRALITFESLPSEVQIMDRSERLAILAKSERAECVMIGGAPYLMRFLEEELESLRIKYVYAFTRRIVEETVNPDGTVKKVAQFKHEGFVHV